MIFRNRHIVCISLAAFLLSGCSPCSLHEAERVLSRADSVRAEGCLYGRINSDSLQLANAYRTLGLWKSFRPDEYARCCYHYGRLLREKDNPVAAMQCFINATHTHTRDYHILGRVYSNMGSICHLANDFSLAYEMYGHSADMFRTNGDTTAYFFALNDMAFELAEDGKKEKAYVLLGTIENIHDYPYLKAKVIETKAVACKKVQQYDSVIYYSSVLDLYDYHEPLGLLVRSQAYSYLGIRDSAAYYARLVLDISNVLDDVNNALYVLTNDDQTKDLESVRQTAAERSDVQKLIEIRRSKLSQAVQLLQQDLLRKPDWTWLYVMCLTILSIVLILGIYIYKKRRKHQLLSQKVSDLAIMNHEAKLRYDSMVKEHNEYTVNLAAKVEQNCLFFAQSEDFPDNLSWKKYDAMCRIINDNFGLLEMKLQNMYQLGEKEIRLCILVLVANPSSKQLSDMLFYSESGIRNYKNRVAKKIGTNSTELRHFLINLAINEYPVKG